jgi:type IV secretion system protein VirD4
MSIGYKKPDSNSKRTIAIIALIVTIIATTTIYTQLIARAFGYSDTLGAPIYWKIYLPWKGITWYLMSGSDYPILFAKQLNMSLSAGGLLFGACILILLIYKPITKGNKSLYGTARFADMKDIEEMGLLTPPKGGNAVIVGGIKKRATIQYLYHQGPEHVLGFAPSRSGKGVALMLPTLFTWLDSVVILDIKGEGWALTSGWRKTYAKNKVLKFDPTDDSGCGARFNPLGEIRINDGHDVADAQIIANMLVDPDGHGLVDHWQKTSYAMLTGVILHLLYKHIALEYPPPTLPDIIKCLSNPDQTPDEFFEEMQNNDYYKGLPHPVAATAAQDQLNRAEREASSVLSSAISYLTLYRDPILAANVSRSDFKINDLMNYSEPVSLYLVLRPSDKERLMPLIRLIITLITTKLTGKMEFSNGKSVAHYKHKLLLLLDEFTALRKLELLEQQLPFLAGYGIKCYFLIQDLKQLHRWYTGDESISPNCHIRIAFAANEIKTAGYLSQATGDTTVVKVQTSASGDRMSAMLGKVSKHYSEVKRPLLTADEIMRLPSPVKDRNGMITKPGEMLIFVSGQPPIRGTQPLYFMDDYFSERAKVNSPSASDAL